MWSESPLDRRHDQIMATIPLIERISSTMCHRFLLVPALRLRPTSICSRLFNLSSSVTVSC